MAWLSGYDGWSFYVHQGVIIGPKGDPIFWGRKMDAIGATLTCYMSNDRIHGYSDDFVMSDKHAMSDLAEIIAGYGWSDKILGVELDNYYYSAKAHHILSRSHNSSIIDATGLINWCRAVKSERELKYIHTCMYMYMGTEDFCEFYQMKKNLKVMSVSVVVKQYRDTYRHLLKEYCDKYSSNRDNPCLVLC